ncbi:hypothetical protein Tsubulata_029310 [Turnera subulata]|uniref:Uncharacterized protein n=1 Tax=Turnera subulata TaxID=218843 RepID=A0A9Q0J4T8_9ROSI|nr:hypothetical protein Tsubulata_029310 [Turnera subulata]
MVFITCICMPHPSLHCLFLASPKPKPFSSLAVNSAKQEEHPFLLNAKFGFSRPLPLPPNRRRLRSVCFFNSGKESNNNAKLQDDGLELAIFKRWDVPWQWDDVSLTSLACVVRFSFPGSFLLTGVAERAAIPFLGLKIEELSLDEKAEILFLDQSITTAVVLGVLYRIINTLQPHPEDVFCYNLREPLNLQKGWLLWAGIGFACTVLASALTGIAMSIFNSEAQQQETDTLVRLLPLIGSSTIRTACLVGVTGVLAPILEETVFRGFFMVSLTKWCGFPSVF